jgi:hypothetical protein
MTDPLASWKDDPAKQAILTSVSETTTSGGATFVEPDT